MGEFFSNVICATLTTNVYAEDDTFCGGQLCRGAPYAIYDKFSGASAQEVKVYEATGHLIILHNSGVNLINDTLGFLGQGGF